MIKPLLRKVTNIAIKSQKDVAKLTTHHDVYRKLYASTELLTNPAMNPQSLLNPKAPPTINTFPTFVALYIAPKNWPRIAAAGGDPQPLVKQIPGDHEYQILTSALHVDKNPGHHQMRTRRLGGVALYSKRREISPPIRSRNLFDPASFFLEPNEAMDTLLNAGYNLWKDTICLPAVAQDTYISAVMDDTEFSQKSPDHEKLLSLFNSWINVSSHISNVLTPRGHSFAEVHHYIHTEPAVDDTVGDSATSPEPEEGEMTEMTDRRALDMARRLTRRRGRPKAAGHGRFIRP
jgi:hypothetical protein